MKKYISPFVMFLNGTITLSSSQLGELGIDVDVAEWNSFWADVGEDVKAEHPDFDVNDQSTWYNGFNLGDPDTWFNLLF